MLGKNFSYIISFLSTFNLVKIGPVWRNGHLEKDC